MPKALYIAEKPSVAKEFVKALKENFSSFDGYLESEKSVVSWCVGHLVTMSYPEKYDPKYKKWTFETLPFLPKTFRYEIIGAVRKQFGVVRDLLHREDIDTIYECTDSGREGEYIFRLVLMMARLKEPKKTKRVWIDSQTEEEILRGIREAKDMKAYDRLSDAAFLRAKEDYLMGINFSRALSLKYGGLIASYMQEKYQAIAVGRVMTCVLGMVVRREWEIRKFVKTSFYRIIARLRFQDLEFEGEWHRSPQSSRAASNKLYKENGFLDKKDAEDFIDYLQKLPPEEMAAEKVEKKTTRKNPPLLYNLAEIQNDCSKIFKISPDETLRIIQNLYEKKLCTYPRTDARVLSSAIAKVIDRNLKGLLNYSPAASFASEILAGDSWKKIGKTRYTNDKQITDHYAIIPTGEGLRALAGLPSLDQAVYRLLVLRFLSIFYPPAEYKKVTLTSKIKEETFLSNFSIRMNPGYQKVIDSFKSQQETLNAGHADKETEDAAAAQKPDEAAKGEQDERKLATLSRLRKGSRIDPLEFLMREGETSPPKRYTSGSMILAMETAGQLIEDEELREQIKGSGIGTSATRAEILKKLFKIHYLSLNKKTQVITPTKRGEMIYLTVRYSISPLLNPELTASWEKGLTMVAEGSIPSEEYLQKLESFVSEYTEGVRRSKEAPLLKSSLKQVQKWYDSHGKSFSGSRRSRTGQRKGISKKKTAGKDLSPKDTSGENPSGVNRSKTDPSEKTIQDLKGAFE